MKLLAYDRQPTTVAEANNEDISLSLHLALEEDGAWEPPDMTADEEVAPGNREVYVNVVVR